MSSCVTVAMTKVWRSRGSGTTAPTFDQDELVDNVRNFSPWHAWMTALRALEPPEPMPAGDDELAGWRDRGRNRLVELLGPFPEPVPLRLEVTASERTPAYVRHRVVYDTEATMSVPAYLLVPDGPGPRPGVLAVHGHGPGKAAICGLDDSAPAGGDYAHRLAESGYVVLAPDLRCFGERADWNPPDHYACDTNLVHAVMAGQSPLSQNLFDLCRSLDVLEARPEVDPQLLGAVGFSYGATMVLFLAALDERVKAAVVSGYLSSVSESHKVPWNMCGSQVLFGMLGRLEHLDVAAQVAPRALLVETGSEDLLFPLGAAQATVASLRRLYRLHGAEGCLVHEVFDGDHRWQGQGVETFLSRHLMSRGPNEEG